LSKHFESKNGSVGWGPGPEKLGQKREYMPLL